MNYDELITIIPLQVTKGYEYNVQKQRHNKKKIFLVDDEPDTRLLYKIVLQ